MAEFSSGSELGTGSRTSTVPSRPTPVGTPPGSGVVRSVLSSGTFTQPKSKPISMVQRANIMSTAAPQRPSSPGSTSLASSTSSISGRDLGGSNANLGGSNPSLGGVTPLGTPPASPGRHLLEAGYRAESPGHFTMQFSPEIQLLLKKSVSVSESTDDYERAVNEEKNSGAWQRKVEERANLLQRVASNDSLGSSVGGSAVARRVPLSRETSEISLRSSPEPRTSEVNSSTHSSCESAIPVKGDVPLLLLPRSPRPESGGVLDSVVSGRGLVGTTRDINTVRDTSRDTTIYLSPRREEEDEEESKVAVISAPPTTQTPPKEVVYDLDGITWETVSKSIKYGKQLASILSKCRNNLCRMGWKCWETEVNCGGAFAEEADGSACSFLHREPIVKTEESIAQFVLALSFLRRCIASKTAVSSDLFLRAIDNYVASGLEKHPCSVAMVRNIKDEIDVAAERYAKGLPLDPHHEEKPQPHTERVQRGIIIAAALSLGCAKLDDMMREDYVNLVSGAAIPVYIEPPMAEYSASFITSPRRGSIAGQPSFPIQPMTVSPRRGSVAGLPPLSPSSLGVVPSPRRVSHAGNIVPSTAASIASTTVKGNGGIMKKLSGLFSPRSPSSSRKDSPRKPE